VVAKQDGFGLVLRHRRFISIESNLLGNFFILVPVSFSAAHLVDATQVEVHVMHCAPLRDVVSLVFALRAVAVVDVHRANVESEFGP
jgi:hypothetical protein